MKGNEKTLKIKVRRNIDDSISYLNKIKEKMAKQKSYDSLRDYEDDLANSIFWARERLADVNEGLEKLTAINKKKMRDRK